MFVTFEGPEGAGKSTALAQVAQALRDGGHDVLTTREPGAGEFGQRIREILLHGGSIPNRSELLLFLADRAHHVERIILPALESGRIVLCDRYADSTLVYQGFVRGFDREDVERFNMFATGGLLPELTLLFDLPVEIGLARVKEKDRLDSEPVEFHQAVRDGFLQLYAEEPQRIVKVDAMQSSADCVTSSLAAILARLA